MSKQYPGGIISKTAPVPSGPFQNSTASGIWTLDQQAYWQKLGQWPTAGNFPKDPQFNYVTMLLHGDGTNGAQNNTFVDSSSSPFAVTRNGNTTQGSFSPYGSNWSNFFPNASPATNYLVSSSVSLSGDFTIEGYVNWNGEGPNPAMFTLGDSSLSTGIEVYKSGANWILFASNGNRVTGSAAVAGQWTYLAVTRSGTTVTLYINGVSQGTWTSSQTFSGTIKVGAEFYGSTYYSSMSGYISNFRVNNTTAINTVPTAPLTAVSGTIFLTCQSNRFIDNSASPLTITVTGTPSVQRFNPFGTSTAYSTSVIGGSGYFDGTGDNLSVAANSSNIGTGDFNITFWLYFPTEPLNGVPATNAYNGTAFTNGWYFYTGVGTDIFFGVGSAGGADGVSGSVNGINSWHYVEATRSGSTLSLYLDGVLAQSKSNTKTGTVSGNITRIGARYDGGGNAIAQYITDFKVVVGTAGNTSNYTPPTAPASATGSTLMLSMQNAGIFDNAMMNNLETLGNAQISTSVVKYGTGSLAFDGTGDVLKSPDSLSIAFGSGNFTVEGWINLNSVAAPTKGIIFGLSENAFGLRVGQGYLGSRNGLNIVRAGVADLEYCAFTFAINTWYHIAVVRSGTTIYFFVDGVQQTTQGSGGSSYTFPASPLGLYVGANNDGNENFNGYIDDLRITKGYARYTANFTPPTEAFLNIGPN
jgi:hypothetical protein